jgi:pimeloyl-ACP methyl ester carboxylesterase
MKPRNNISQALQVLRLLLLLTFALSSGLYGSSARAVTAQAATLQAPAPGQCLEGSPLPHGARALICVPASGWNGDLVIWGHGYVAYHKPDGSVAPLDFYHIRVGDLDLPNLLQQLGFAFATTSYRQNGLTILEGVEDVVELQDRFISLHGKPGRTYMVGASEGGAITTLLMERHAGRFSGGLAGCGPIGDFQRHINYIGDFRVLFDYFFPSVLPGSPVDVPFELISGWESTYKPAVQAALTANPSAARQLIKTSRAPIDPQDPSTVETTTVNLLWYFVFGEADARSKLGGNPFTNRGRFYVGSDNDLLLNLKVPRFDADQAALQNVAKHQTSGLVTKPLVTLHTTRDEQVPFAHELLYHAKVKSAGSSAYVTQIPTVAYGHCNFTKSQLLGSFALLVKQVAGSEPAGIKDRVDLKRAKSDFEQQVSE